MKDLFEIAKDKNDKKIWTITLLASGWDLCSFRLKKQAEKFLIEAIKLGYIKCNIDLRSSDREEVIKSLDLRALNCLAINIDCNY